ncbi:hypothetical protein V8D89_010189 [Ganoderma adspersum]
MNASRRSRTSSKNPLRPSQTVRHRSSRLRRPLTEYIRNGARAVSDALNAITTVFAPVHNASHNAGVAVRFEREQTPEGDFHEPASPVVEDGEAANTVGDGDNAGAGLSADQPGAQPQAPAAPAVGVALVGIPIARRAIRRRNGTVVQPAQPWQEPIAIAAPRSLQDAGFQLATPRRRAALQREGAFHEDLMPIDAPERQNVAGRDPSTLYENLVWDAQWGPIPRLADVSGNGEDHPTTHQVLTYLNDRFRFNRRAYNTALDVLFPPEGREPRDPTVVNAEPAFQRVAPTALWRQDSDWEGGVVPVDREWGAPQADDAADPEAEPFDPAEFAYSYAEDDMAELTDEELLAIQEHISACLASRLTRISVSVSAQPSPASWSPSSLLQPHSTLTSLPLPGPSSIAPSRSSASRKATRGRKGAQGTRSAASTSAAASTRARTRLSSTSRAQSRTQAFARRADRRNVARARLQDTIRKNLKKRKLARAAASSSSSRRSSPRSRPQTRAPAARSAAPSPSPSTPVTPSSSPSRQLRSSKRLRGEGEGGPDAGVSPERDGSTRSKRARRS